MNKLQFIGVMFIVIALLVSCSGGADPGQQETTGLPQSAAGLKVLRMAGSVPPTLDPHLTGDATSAEYIVEIYSGLVTYDRDLNIVPDLAELWEISGDGLTYTFLLRENAVFHDGKKVTAHDVKWSIERACDFRTRSTTADTYLGDIVGCSDKLRGKAEEVSGVQVLNDSTISLTIYAPRQYFLDKLTYPTAYILNKENVEAGGRTWTDNPNGTGPYKLKEHKLGEYIILAKNDLYYREPMPKIDEVHYTLVGGTRMVLYEQGQLDIVAVGINDIDRILDPGDPLHDELNVIPSMGVFYISFNANVPPFDDPNIRRAFSMAINKDHLVSVVYKDTVAPAHAIVPPAVPGYDNSSIQDLPYDPDAARALIAAYDGNLDDITFQVLGSGGSASKAIEALVALWEETLGIKVAIQMVDWTVFLMDLHNPDNKIQMWGGDAGWIADYPDPHNFLDILFRCDSQQNNTHYCNAEVDALLDAANACAAEDEACRNENYLAAEQILMNDAAIMPLHFGTEYWLVKPWVKDAYFPPLMIPRLQYMDIEK